MSKSNIEWTEYSWNPVTGCDKVSAGCKNCYAEKMFNRLVAMGSNDYVGRKFTDVKCHPHRLSEPMILRKPSMIFVNSMSDLFHEDVSGFFIDKVFSVIRDCPQHIFQILTKRPERMKEYMKGFNTFVPENDLPPHWKNLWLGVSVENQKTADERIPLLLQTPAKVRWLSIEPMLEPIDILEWIDKIDWIVLGCESGHNRRKFEMVWAEHLLKQCRTNTYWKPIFIKQLLINGKVVKDISQFPKHLQIREYPQ